MSADTKTTEAIAAFTDLRSANVARQRDWCPNQLPDLSFRGNELAGETGEVCNVIKKLERERHGWRGSRDTIDHLAEELADVVICADLVAISAGIDLNSAVATKFNATSEKVGLPHRIMHRGEPCEMCLEEGGCEVCFLDTPDDYSVAALTGRPPSHLAAPSPEPVQPEQPTTDDPRYPHHLAEAQARQRGDTIDGLPRREAVPERPKADWERGILVKDIPESEKPFHGMMRSKTFAPSPEPAQDAEGGEQFDLVLNSYADENQKLHDRAERAEAELAKAREEVRLVEVWGYGEQAGRHKAEEDRVELRGEVERLRAALHGLVDRDASYHGSEIRIQADSHSDAIRRVATARAAIRDRKEADHGR